MSSPTFIQSRANPLLARVRKLLRDPGAGRTLRQVWLEGEHLCQAYAERGGQALHALVTERAWEDTRTRSLAQQAARVAVLPGSLFDGISGLESPAGIGYLITYPEEGGVRAGQRSVVLDRLQDAGNVGNVLRSAAALGVPQVLALKGTAALWSPKVLRAAMGAHFGLHLVELLEPADLDALGVPLVATSSHVRHALHDADLPEPCAWVFGHEGQGVAPGLLQRCALTIRIPQPGGQESLNVGSAAAICLYESLRRRLMSAKPVST